VADLLLLSRMGVEAKRKANVGSFSSGQRVYLDYHRNDILLKAGLKMA
jgi:putative restriction endonuclease